MFWPLGQSKGKQDWDNVFITKSGDSQLTKNHCQNHNERRKEVRSPATAVGDWPASRFPRTYIIRQLRAPGAFSWNKHCQRHHGPKALSALTHSTTLFKAKASTSFEIFSLILFGKGREKRRTTLTNPRNIYEISMYRFKKNHVTSKRNSCINFNKSM